MLADPAGVNHIMKECYSYPKPPEVRGPLARILGKGLQHAEGEHGDGFAPSGSPLTLFTRRRRPPPSEEDHGTRVLDCSSARPHPDLLRRSSHGSAIVGAGRRPKSDLCSSLQLRDQWLDLITAGEIEEGAFKDSNAATAFEKQEGETVVDAMKWLSRAALDIIGLGTSSSALMKSFLTDLYSLQPALTTLSTHSPLPPTPSAPLSPPCSPPPSAPPHASCSPPTSPASSSLLFPST